jgi:hypothetical protein
MLIAIGTTFTALTDCTDGHCGTPSELDRVYLGLGVAYLLLARLAFAALYAMLNEARRTPGGASRELALR